MSFEDASLRTSTIQSSAYVPECVHGSLSKRLSFATRKATLYFVPNFSNSAITQSVMHGMPAKMKNQTQRDLYSVDKGRCVDSKPVSRTKAGCSAV